jgi:putative nucleotidyltransferase with HDIG domain
MEFLKMLTQPHVGKALRYLRDIGALPHFLPELQACVGCTQNKYHDYDVFEHTVRVVENTVSDDPYVRLGALLHDIGKPKVKWVGKDGVAHFYKPEEGQEFLVAPEVAGAHEDVGAKMAYRIMSRFRFSTNHATRVSAFVREHMFAQSGSKRVARRLLARLDHVPGGLEANAEALFAIRFGDIRGGKSEFSTSDIGTNERLLALVRAELANDAAVTVRDLAVDGHDLMALGITGPDIGATQRYLLDLVLDDPVVNTRDGLLERARTYKAAREVST